MMRWASTFFVSVSAAALAAPEIERSVSTPVTTITREELERLPAGRRLEDLIRTCPAQTIPSISPNQTRIDGLPANGRPPVDLACLKPDDLRMIEIFRQHNIARASYGSPPLVWDPMLARGAADYARQLTALGRVHAPREGRRDVRENLLQSLRGGRSPKQMVDVWVDEKRFFKPGVFPDVSTTGDWAKVGHYTQMIWPTTVRLGCAIHSDARYDWTVCRYSPPGNRDGVAMRFPSTIIAQSPLININNPPRPPLLQNAPDEDEENGGEGLPAGGANEGANQAGQAEQAGETRERPRPSTAPPNEGISRTTGNCGASVIARVKIIEVKDPNNPNKRRRVKESHNLAHGFTEIVVPFGWDADVDWMPDPNPAETFPAPGTMTASWSIVGQPARRNAIVTGGYGQLQKGWDREWGLIRIDPANRPEVQQHRIEAEWDPVPETNPDKCPTGQDFAVTFAGPIPAPGPLDIKNFVERAGGAGFTGTRPRTRFTTGTRAFHEARPQPFSRNNNVVVPIGIYWDLPEGCCGINGAERKVIQFARAAIHGPNGRQGKGWGLDIHPKELKRATDSSPDDHNPTYTSNPGSDADPKLKPGSGGGTRANSNDENDLEQWDAPGMPKDLFDRLHAAQGASVYRQQFLSLLVCRPRGPNRVATYLEGGAKVCQVAITTVRWDFPGQRGVVPRPPRPGAPPVMPYRQPTITISFDVRDGHCSDLGALLRANSLLDIFQHPDKDGRNLEILSEEPYQQLDNSVSNWEANPFADLRIPQPPE